MSVSRFQFTLFTLALGSMAIQAQQPKYPPLSQYLMPRDTEIALARSAAPDSISGHATIKVFTASGYQTAHNGDNGFVCIVMRGFTGAPTFTPAPIRAAIAYDPNTRAPICLDPQAVRMVLPYYEFRTRLGLAGKTPEQIAQQVQSAYNNGELPKRTSVSFGYMWSAGQVLGPAGHWHPHMMVFAPNYQNSMLGNNPGDGHLPAVSDDEATPFTVVVIPVDPDLFIQVKH